MRVWFVVLLLAGCDIVYGLEGRQPPGVQPGDEDGDGTFDTDDPCPHIPNESATDRDSDGISIDCDPDDDDGSTMSRWYPITAGSIEDLTQDGVGEIADDGFILGDHRGLSALVFDVDTDTATIDIGFKILSSAVETDFMLDWSEIGVTTVHRSFQADRKERGDICFYGIDSNPAATPPVGDGYLETSEDDMPKPKVSFPSPVNGTIGRFHQTRSPLEVACSVVRPNKTTPSLTFAPDKLVDETGKIAISAEYMTAKITYVWIAWQPL